ncbi:MAG: InlB B-repeat-containing protein, partial [Clostridia bacterium]|nr:InlB B-repeat-containing protein [Clostridia bacterium]
YGLNANSSLLADWTPICGSKDSPYCGTFDGQGYAISGLYYNTPGYQYDAYGFIAYMGEGGTVKDLTVKDTYFYIKYTSHFTPYVAGIAAYSSNATNKIENCHFDGVAGGDSSSKGCVAGGITAITGGKIQNCTAKGRVLGYDSYVGYGKAGGIAGHAYTTAAIFDCINYAEVLCWDSGSAQGTAGGIVGYLYGTVKECSNRGVINGYNRSNNNNAGGIVGWASGTTEQRAMISRCFNVASFDGSGIVDYISKGYVTVKNCYNAGSVTIGIAGITNGAGISITYCHDVGYTGKPIGGYSSTDDVEIDHCYYIDRVSYDTDRNPMTDAKLSEEFADGTVLALLDNGHWTQGEEDEYPVLAEPKYYTVSFDANGGEGTMEDVPFVEGEYTLPDCSLTPPEGKRFSGWQIGEDTFEQGTIVPITTDTVIYAVWEDLPRYTVSYDPNGGEGAMVGDTVIENGTFTLADCTYTAPQGYKFKAWAIGTVDGEQKQPGEEMVITAETCIYAIWEEDVTILYGDVDGDGKVSAADALEVLKSVVGKVTLTDDQFKAADTDGNGKADATDALNILKKVVGKIDKFPVEA